MPAATRYVRGFATARRWWHTRLAAQKRRWCRAWRPSLQPCAPMLPAPPSACAGHVHAHAEITHPRAHAQAQHLPWHVGPLAQVPSLNSGALYLAREHCCRNPWQSQRHTHHMPPPRLPSCALLLLLLRPLLLLLLPYPEGLRQQRPKDLPHTLFLSQSATLSFSPYLNSYTDSLFFRVPKISR